MRIIKGVDKDNIFPGEGFFLYKTDIAVRQPSKFCRQEKYIFDLICFAWHQIFRNQDFT